MPARRRWQVRCDVRGTGKEIARAASLARFSDVIARAGGLVERLERLDPRRPSPNQLDVRDLVKQRSAALGDLAKALPDATGEASSRLRDLTRRLAGSVVIEVGGGSYLMGCTEGDHLCQEDEQPPHFVKVAPFELDAAEVTVAQFRAFVSATGGWSGPQPTFEQSLLDPVVNVSWTTATSYCDWVGGRLPTEAEWELAARSGSDTQRYPSGRHLTHEDANYEGVRGRDRWRYTSPVGSFPATNWGFYDLAGNVWEWCADTYTRSYRDGTRGDDEGSTFHSARVIRGGSWLAGEDHLRHSTRMWFPASRHMFNIGFRCARDSQTEASAGVTP